MRPLGPVTHALGTVGVIRPQSALSTIVILPSADPLSPLGVTVAVPKQARVLEESRRVPRVPAARERVCEGRRLLAAQGWHMATDVRA